MKKHFLYLFLVLLVTSWAMAQERTVSGTVKDENAQPLGGVNVVIKGTTRGTTTDANGAYQLRANAGDVLVFGYVGYQRQEVTLGNQSTLDLSLAPDDRTLNEVVITALGIRREAKALTYATQSIKPAQLNEVRDANVLNTLQGKIAGAYITQGSGGVGSGSRIVLRGNRSIQGTNNALVVVDGVPINNSTYSIPTSDFGAVAGTDGASNVNPDDIEDVTVLRGASAAALYGSQAANGVILITTKRGKSGRVMVDLNSGVSFDRPFALPRVQNQYGQGVGGQINVEKGESWGAAMTGQTYTNHLGQQRTYSPQPDNIRDFFRTAAGFNNSISVMGGSEKSQTYLSYTNNALQGTVPRNQLMRHTINLRLTNQISSKLSTDAKITYINQGIDNKPRTGEENAPVMDIYQISRNISLDDAKNYERTDNLGVPTPTAWPSTLASIYQNPYWMINRTSINERRDRVIGFLTGRYQLTPFLSIQARANLDKYFDKNEQSYSQGTVLWASQPGGAFARENIITTQKWFDLILEGKNAITSGIQIDYRVGAILQDSRFERTRSNANGLNIANRFNLNFGSTQTLGDDFSRSQTQSIFGQATISFKDAVFIDASLRNDWASTLPKPHSFQYPSVGVSAILSDLFKMNGALSFLKVNASYAQVGNAASPYLLRTNYSYSQGAGTGFISRDGTQAIGNLKPEITKSLEFGVDARFMDNRLGANLTVYKSNSINQLLTLGLAPASGFSRQYINAGDIQNSGIELVINGTAIRNDRFTWDLTFNLGRNVNKIKRLSPEVKRSVLAGGYGRSATPVVEEGGSYGDMLTYRWLTNASGQYVVTNDGRPVATTEQVAIGNFNPKFLMGLTNTFTYKGISLRVLVDGRVGGVVTSGTEMNLASSGIPEVTSSFREGGWILPGVTTTGEQNTKAINAETFWRTVSGGRYGWGEFFTYDATNFRVRELSLGYGIPIKSNQFIKSMRLSFVARNLLWIYRGKSTLDIPGIGKRTMWFDPDINLGNGNFQGVEYGTLPANRTVGLNLKLSF
ncbi:SusC/RagA family TonB-linked outer membrane protein [Larkinella soli]|uniref:SusC/RagA family TonB-linked outer membrane protein n=1 Tax=Larkinella soli TaxID=1770527 RepID=UPI000FFB2D5E|nr:SusC/RagA family TonB-linked outer membrane protein [Larkinella soli]